MSRVLLSFALVVTATGGCTAEDDDIWMPPTASGKADGITTIPGNTIPSSNVDPTKDYLSSRRIDSLAQVGALSGDVLAIAMRADGIIANLPANGRIEAAELARMEAPQIYATLFPNEQAALPQVWPLLVAPSAAATNVPAPAPDLTVTDQTTMPGGLTPPASILITSLDASLQTVARRVQLVFNGDSAATTIQIADIEHVLSDPQAFTPAEVDQLKAILAVFHARATSSEDARVAVPTPGTTAVHKVFGMAAIDLEANVVLREMRSYAWSAQSSSWSGQLQLDLTLVGSLTAGASDALILLDLNTGDEQVFRGASNQLVALGGGEHVLERYVAGVRKESHGAVLPELRAGTTTTDLSKYIDYTLVTAGGTVLVKNAVSTMRYANTTQGGTAEFHFETTQVTNPNVDANILSYVATPPVTLPTGHYEIPTNVGGTATLDIFPQGVVLLGFNSVPVKGAFATWGYPDLSKLFVANPAGQRVQLKPDNNQVYVWNGQHTYGEIVTPARRTK